MEFGRQLLFSANLWFFVSLFCFVAFRFARLRNGKGFGGRRAGKAESRESAR